MGADLTGVSAARAAWIGGQDTQEKYTQQSPDSGLSKGGQAGYLSHYCQA